MHDTRLVALIKSVATKNRFYALVRPESGIRNADMVDVIPDDLLLGIAYPCLEDGLNDFAVIRTTFETLDLFPDDDPIRDEMMEIINDARSNLLRRIKELRDRLANNTAHFLGTDYNEFKGYALQMVEKGYPRRNLDSMMKLNVFTSVAEAEGHTNPHEILYYYEFGLPLTVAQGKEMPAREFIVTLFDDVMHGVVNDDNYKSKYIFDRYVFQKFIAVMFVNYATTDPMFYGINKSDYGVSGDKEMDSTPLYQAIRKELNEIEERMREANDPIIGSIYLPEIGSSAVHPANVAPNFTQDAPFPDFSGTPTLPGADTETPSFLTHEAGGLTLEQASNLLPSELVNEDVLLGPLTQLCSAAKFLLHKEDADTQKFAALILSDASKLVSELKRLNIISPFANDPGDMHS